MPQKKIDIEEAKSLINSDMGKILKKQAMSYSCPLSLHEHGNKKVIANGSCGFIQPIPNSKIYMVTAYHVYEKALNETLNCYLGGKLFNLDKNLHSFSSKYDIATFNIDEKFINEIKLQIIKLKSKDWPPPLPTEKCGIFFCGWLGVERRQSLDLNSLDFGAFICLGAVNSVSELNITIHLDPEFLIPDDNQPPDGYKFGGISGAPALAYYYKPDSGIEYWDFVGIIYEDSPSMNYFKLRPATLINKDGTIKNNL